MFANLKISPFIAFKRQGYRNISTPTGSKDGPIANLYRLFLKLRYFLNFITIIRK